MLGENWPKWLCWLLWVIGVPLVCPDCKNRGGVYQRVCDESQHHLWTRCGRCEPYQNI